MRNLVDIDKDLSKYRLMLPSATKEVKRALEKRIEQLEWERLVIVNERGVRQEAGLQADKD